MTTTATYSFLNLPGFINEGDSYTINIATTDVLPGTPLWWALDFSKTNYASSSTVADFTGSQNPIDGSFLTDGQGFGYFNLSLLADQLTEGTETFNIQIRKISQYGDLVLVSTPISIIDTSNTVPIYSFTSVPSSINEGASGTFNVSTVNVANGTTLYWTVNYNGLSDFSATSGSFNITAGIGSFSISPSSDNLTEGPETFTISLRTGSQGGPVIATSNPVTINDISLSTIDYNFSSIPSSIDEGEIGTFRVATGNVANGTTLYWTLDYNSSSSVADFPFPQSGSFIVNSNTGTFTVGPIADFLTEGSETVKAQIRTNGINGLVVATSNPVVINDISDGRILPSSTFNVYPLATSINEPSYTNVQVITTNVQNGAVLYWTIDYNNSSSVYDFNQISGDITIVNNAASFQVYTNLDYVVEGNETFKLQLRKNSTTGPIVATSIPITISDTSRNDVYFPGIDTFRIRPGDILQASDYNTLTNYLINNIMGTPLVGYGATLKSSPVSIGQPVTYIEWNNLYDDLLRCSIHQLGTGASIPGKPSRITTGETITATNVNIYASSLQYLYNNRRLVSTATQISSTTTNSISIREKVNPWIAEIEHDIDYNWASAAELRYFFNLGGYIKPTLSYISSELPGNTTATAWAALIDTFNSQNYTYTGPTNYPTGLRGRVDAPEKSIQLSYDALNGVVTSNLIFFDTTFDEGEVTNVTFISTATLYYSNDLTGGIAAPIPQIIPKHLLSQAGFYAIITSDPRPVPLITFPGGSSASQIIRLNNIGTENLVVTGITPTSDISTGLLTSISGVTFPFTIAAESFVNITLTYGGTPPANIIHKGSLRIQSVNNAYGDYVISTTFKALFTADVLPATYSQTVTVDSPISIPFSITAIGGTADYCVVNSITGNTPGFTIATGTPFYRSGGPVTYGPIYFNLQYNPHHQVNGAHTITFNVTVYSTEGASATASATVTINQLIIDQHLGNWVSALGSNNSVVAFSYDIIGGRKYLSFGASMGSGNADLSQGGTLQVSAAMTMLGPKVADNTGPALVYPYQNTAYGSFLNMYGVWNVPNGGTGSVSAWDTTASPYTVDAPHISGSVTYYYQFSCDNSGYFYIDGAEIAGNADYVNPTAGTISLTPGRHSISWSIDNQGGPGAVGLRIYKADGTDIWSTLTPIGNSQTQIPYWLDLGRIQLDQGYRIYYSNSYYIRNSGYGNYFGVSSSQGSMFTIVDDGYGNLSIALNTLREYSGDAGANVTLGTLTESFYYYSSNSTHPRYNNLESPFGSGQTHYFTGFTAAGVVTNTVVAHPVSPPPPPPPVIFRGGCGRSGGGGYTASDGLGRAYGCKGQSIGGDAQGSNGFGNFGGGSDGSVGGGSGMGAANGAATCFIKGTLVTLADGTRIAIEDVKIGDYVLGSSSVNQVIGYDRPMLIIDNIREGDLYGFNGSEKFITSEHPVMTKQGWKAVDQITAVRIDPHLDKILIGNLEVGDEVLREDGSYMIIDSIEKYKDQSQQELYNLLLDGDHTFYANGLLVHNKGGGDGGDGGDGGGCFLPDAIISMADGSNKKLIDLRAGDLVLGAFGEINPVLAIYYDKMGNVPMYKVNGEHDCTDDEVFVTTNKQFYCIDPDPRTSGTIAGWKESYEMDLGDGNTDVWTSPWSVGLVKLELQKAKLGIELQTVNGGKKLETFEPYYLPTETKLYNCVVGGSHTIMINGYAHTAWVREDDFDYTIWEPIDIKLTAEDYRNPKKHSI